MKDVNYFIVEASNRTHTEFELDYADVVEVFDASETHLTTEDGKSLIISWDERGYFKSYFVDVEPITYQMSQSSYIEQQVKGVIETLKYLTYNGQSVDGETMQYILNKIGMEDQMLRQLIMSQPIEEVRYMIEEREENEEEFEYEGDIEDLQGN
jgi:hypothetical protein